MLDRLRKIRHVALDMDGTIYSGRTLFPFTQSFLASLDAMNIGHTFLTNNSSRSAGDYLKHLGALGIDARADQLYTSTQATIEYLKTHHPDLTRLLVLGTRSMQAEMRGAGFDVVENDPDAVIVGFDTELEYAAMCRAGYWIKRGKPFIATHPDRICPTDQPTLLVDCGAICAALESATGRKPDKVLGKPDVSMIRGILNRHALNPDELAVAGDRLYTDMAMARSAGALGVLVLTGESTRHQAEAHHPPPDVIVESLEEFGAMLRQSRGVTG